MKGKKPQPLKLFLFNYQSHFEGQHGGWGNPYTAMIIIAETGLEQARQWIPLKELKKNFFVDPKQSFDDLTELKIKKGIIFLEEGGCK